MGVYSKGKNLIDPIRVDPCEKGGVDENDTGVALVTIFCHYKECSTLKEITCQTEQYLVILSSKTYLFEYKLTKVLISLTSYFLLCST